MYVVNIGIHFGNILGVYSVESIPYILDVGHVLAMYYKYRDGYGYTYKELKMV